MSSSFVSQNSVQSEVCVCVFVGSALQREEKRVVPQMHTHLYIYIYIYIYYTLHTLVGRLDLMGQSRELG